MKSITFPECNVKTSTTVTVKADKGWDDLLAASRRGHGGNKLITYLIIEEQDMHKVS